MDHAQFWPVLTSGIAILRMIPLVENGLKPIKPRQLDNEWILKVYATALLGLILVFSFFHWARFVAVRYRWSSSHALRQLRGFQIALVLIRACRSYAVRKAPGLPSFGHVVLVAAYLMLNIALCVTNVTMAKMSNPAARFGWMTAANITLAVFLGLRNSPLGILTSHTYNRLNVLHRVVGYTAIAQMILHAIFYMMRFGSKHRWDVFLNRPNLEGSISGVGMLVLLFGLLRHRGYEAFVISHIMGSFITILFAGLHRPVWRHKIPIIMMVAAGLWIFDRLVRAVTLFSNLYKTKAALYPLPKGGIRLVVRAQLKKFKPGTHASVWIPGIRAMQTHPFTVVSSTASGLEMVIKSHRGFTKDIYNYATLSPGSPISASVEGPYGSLPNLEHFDRIVLIAGGSGGAFTFGLANTLLSNLEPGSPRLVDFFWSVRSKENLTWFARSLDDLSSYPSNIRVALHVTELPNITTPYRDYSPGSSTPALIAAGDFLPQIGQGGTVESLHRLVLDSSLAWQRNTPLRSEEFDSIHLDAKFNIKYERLRVREAVYDVVQSMGINQRVLIAACGPQSMMNDVMAAAGKCISSDGPSVEVHCENFEW
ncbi:hypothetical protein B0T10DRAFT_606198 [Thelonectria olida]|uniref:ferric-chelate reductase (NADPH) n=1 Tax=Thelonectria olida TaxID=1576542 RepID=A0A9P8W725_9HYPO|nr:hypothetical protein B0T10DRAFT_606198 [Thelonectria olida]